MKLPQDPYHAFRSLLDSNRPFHVVTDFIDVEWVEAAYRRGGFPMAGRPDGYIDWIRPDPRTHLPLDGFHVSRSLKRTLRRGTFTVTANRDFTGVMQGCADRPETWIDDRILELYGELHQQGNAHSVEVWNGKGQLVGGVYGVAFGAAYMAESKFHRETDASKVALAGLVARLRRSGFELLDVQFTTDHLKTLGAIEIPNKEYLKRLSMALQKPAVFSV